MRSDKYTFAPDFLNLNFDAIPRLNWSNQRDMFKAEGLVAGVWLPVNVNNFIRMKLARQCQDPNTTAAA